MLVLLPCCGRSSRYSTDVPKWMLPGSDRQPMLALALEGLAVGSAQVVVAILAEHEERFGAVAGIRSALGDSVQVVVHDHPTSNQPETVARTLRKLGATGPLLVKDSDNRFWLDELTADVGYVAVDSLNNHDAINPRNKSYVQTNHNGLITNMREKEVISDLFSVGGYHFPSSEDYLKYYDRLSTDASDWDRELYLSDVIGSMILDGLPFEARKVRGYEDWGTVHEWRRALLTKRALLVALDGFLFERGSNHFRPTFAEIHPNPGPVEALRKAVDQGHEVVYLSIRHSDLAALTENQLRDSGLPTGPVVYDCPATRWRLLTAPHPSLPFLTGDALELSPDDPNVDEKLIGLE